MRSRKPMINGERLRSPWRLGLGLSPTFGNCSRGVMSIFVGYGLLLGIVGCALGTAMGLAIVIIKQKVSVQHSPTSFVSRLATSTEYTDCLTL